MKYLYTILILSISLISYSQTGPGGVGTPADNSIWLDPLRINQVDQSSINIVADHSGNNINFGAVSSTSQPTFLSSSLNGMPSVSFDGDDVLIASEVSALNSDKTITWIVVGGTSNTSANNAQMLFCNGYYGSNSGLRRMTATYYSSNNSLYNSYVRQSSGALNIPSVSGPGAIISTNLWSNNALTNYTNGNSFGTLTGSTLNPGNHRAIALGRSSWLNSAFHLTGEVNEVIVYNRVINDVERIIIENYLSTKYNLTINNDLFSFEGSGHFYDLIGIGQEAGQSQAIARGTDIATIYNPTSLSDGDYLLAANDDAGYGLNTTDVPGFYTANNGARLEQSWRVDVTGTPGDVDLDFDMTDAGFGNPQNYQLLITTGPGLFTSTTIHTTGFNYDQATNTLTFTDVPLAPGDYFTIGNSDPYIVSVQDGNWSDPNTWNCSCVPDPTNFVLIDDNTTVTLDVNASIENVIINPDGVFDFSSNMLTVNRDFDIQGSIVGGTGTLNMSGISTQNILGAAQVEGINNIIVNNPGNSVNIDNITLELNGQLLVQDGDFNTTNGTFIVNSTSITENGNIGPLTTGTITGDVTVRRFIDSGPADFRDISSPLDGITVAQWDDNLDISGPGFPDGCSFGAVSSVTTPSGCYLSIQYYNTSTAEFNGVSDYNHTFDTRGYHVYMGDDLNNFSGTTIDVTGEVRTGDIVRNTDAGMNLIANPFASNLDFTQLTLSGVGNYFYVYDPSIGNYQWYDGASGTGGAMTGGNSDLEDGIIALGQGFWVENAGSITLNQNAKVSTAATFLRDNEVNDVNRFGLVIESDHSPYKCDAAFYFDENATAGLDAMDMSHLRSENEDAPYIASALEDKEIRLNRFNNSDETVMFPLITNVPDMETYTISATNIYDFDAYSCVYIIDTETGDLHDMKTTPFFTFEPSAIKSTDPRFVLVMTNEECEEHMTGGEVASTFEPLAEEAIKITQDNRDIEIGFEFMFEKNVEVKILNTLGQEVANAEGRYRKDAMNMSIPGNSTGMFFVRVVSGDEQITKKVMVY